MSEALLGSAARLASLTRREREVLGLVAEGRTNAQVAAHLGISVRTVGKHLEHVFEKLETRTRTGAAWRWTTGR